MSGPRLPRAKRSLGQNFLVDATVSRRIVDALGASVGDTVVEIGPGTGALTTILSETGANVLALEFDRDLAAALRVQFHSAANVEIVEADASQADLGRLLANVPNAASATPAKLVANLPYNLSTVILRRLAEQRELFSSLVLMFQKEVVDRIAAVPGSSDRGFLTVVTEAAFTVEPLFAVPPDAFRPRPKVRSTVVKLTPKPRLFDEAKLADLLSVAFRQKRKTLANNLKASLQGSEEVLAAAEIDGSRRAETLKLAEWNRLVDALTDFRR